jgi:hypothetical protein
MSDPYVTSPNLPTDRDVVSTAKEFSGAMTLDLSDDEIKRAMEITKEVHSKHREIWIRKLPFDHIEQIADYLEEFEKELAYRMMTELEVLVRVDGEPCFYGSGPIIDWMGKLDTSSLAKYGQDHEKKEFEVKRAVNRGEDFYGQRGPVDGEAKRRDRGNKKVS